jgi:hypothetical protein
VSDQGEPAKHHFHDWVKNPEHRRAAEREAEERSAHPPPPLSDDEIRGWIEKFLQGTFDYDAKQRLKEVGERIVPFALAGLKDPRVQNTRYREVAHCMHDHLPLETLTDLLEPYGVKEAVPFVAPLVAHGDCEFRKYAALALGSIGHDTCVDPLTSALNDRDDYVRSFALIGLQRAVSEKRANADFREAMFDNIAPLLGRKDNYPSRFRRWWFGWYARLRKLIRMPVDEITHGNFNTAEKVPDCLLGLDSTKGQTVLLDPRHFNERNEYLYRILEALNEHKIAVPPERVRDLLNRLRPKLSDYFVGLACGELLMLLVRSGAADAEATLRDAQTWDNEKVREAAAKGLLLLGGVEDPTGYVLRRLKKVGFKRLTKVQKVYYCVWLLDMEVRNGGFTQYFVNSSGNLAHLTRKALKALGAARTEAILAQAMACLGVAGPARGRDERHEQLAKVFDGQQQNLSELDDAFYKDEDRLNDRLLEFARRDKGHFGAPRGMS